MSTVAAAQSLAGHEAREKMSFSQKGKISDYFRVHGFRVRVLRNARYSSVPFLPKPHGSLFRRFPFSRDLKVDGTYNVKIISIVHR